MFCIIEVYILKYTHTNALSTLHFMFSQLEGLVGGSELLQQDLP